MAVKLGSLIIDVKADTQELVKGMKNAQGAVSSAVKSMKGLIAGLAVGTAFKSAIKAGYDYNKVMEEQQQSITALIAATSKHEDAMGNAITNTELYTRANAEAVSVLKQLEEINKQTPHTMGQTAQLYKAMLPSMKNLGISTEELVQMTKQLSIAAGAGGVEFHSLLAGVDALATGSVMANSDLGRFLATLGLSNDELKNSTNLVKLFEDKLGSFKAPDTMSVAISNLSNAWGKFMGSLTSDSFSGAKELINGLSDVINEYTGYLEGASISARAYLSKMVDGILYAVELSKAAFMGLTDGVGYAFYTMIADVQASVASFVYSLKDLPKIGDEMLALALKINTASNLTRENATQNSEALNAQRAIVKAASDELNKTIYQRINLYDAELQKQKEAAVQQATIAKEMQLTAEQAKKLAAEKEKLAKANKAIRDQFESIRDGYDSEGAAMRKVVSNMELLNTALAKGIITQEEFDFTAKNMGDSYVKAIQDADKETNKLQKTLDDLKDKISGQLEGAMTNTFRSWMDGAKDFGDLFGNMLKDIAAELFRVLVIQQAVSGIKGMLGFSTGGVIQGGAVQAYASGGVVGSPTFFPMQGNKTGLMGEAGPEAIMPLTRVGGDLGVRVDQTPMNVQVINNNNSRVEVQQDGNNLVLLINQIENQIASNMSRGTSPLGGALSLMQSRGMI